jgi:hypothetical protein
MEENEIRQMAEQLSDDDLWELILMMRKMVAQNDASKQT